MPTLLLLSFLVFVQFSSSAQVSDIISVKKKNGLPLKNFYSGVNILFQTKSGEYVEGPIERINNDSVVVRMFVIQRLPTTLGFYLQDTLKTYLTSTHFKDIARIRIYKHPRFLEQRAGPLLMLGGAGYFLLNIINGSYFKQPLGDAKNVKSLATAAGVFGVGFIIHKLFRPTVFTTRRQKITYISLQK